MKKTLSLILLLFLGITITAQSKIDNIKKFYAKNSTAKTSRTISYNKTSKVLNVDGYRIPLNRVSFYYYYNDDFYSYANHFVSVECIDDSNCIKFNGGSTRAFYLPINTKSNTQKFISMLENL